MLEGHGEEAGEGHAGSMTDCISSADGDHVAVEVRLERLGVLGFQAEFAFDGIDDAVGGCFGGLLGSFHYLGNRPVVFQEPHAVSDKIDVLVVGALHVLIDEFPADLAVGKRKLLAKFRASDTAGPDQGLGFDHFAVFGGESVGIDLGDQGVELDLNAFLLQILDSLCSGLLREHVQDASQCLDTDEPAFLLEVDTVFLAKNRQPFNQFTHQLDAGETTAGNDEGKHLLALPGIGFATGLLDDLLNVATDAKCIIKAPQVKGMLLDTGDVEVCRCGSCSNDQLVVCIAGPLALEALVLEIDVYNGILYDIDHFAGENSVEGNLDRILFDTVAGNFMQLSHENVVAVLINQGYFDLVLMLLECFVQSFCSVYSGVSPA